MAGPGPLAPETEVRILDWQPQTLYIRIMNNEAWKSSNGPGDKWQTPPNLWNEIRRDILKLHPRTRVFDPCPGVQALPKTICGQGDGLMSDWKKYPITFVNPPFSNIYPWAEKAALTADSKHCILMLVPARPDQMWWEYFVPYASLIFIRGRVRYVKPNGKTGKSPAFPSVLLKFGSKVQNQFWWPMCHQERARKHAELMLRNQG